MLKSKSKKLFFLDYSSLYIYFESNYLFLYGNLGISKYKLKNVLNFYTESYFCTFNNSFFIKKINLIFIFQLFNRINEFFKSLVYGYTLKYKIIGLGHRAYYSKNLYLFKIGYSHLVFTFIPINLFCKKKKKKKKFYWISSVDLRSLQSFFLYIKSFRIPDIYSKNGIFNRLDFYSFKKGKKSFLL